MIISFILWKSLSFVVAQSRREMCRRVVQSYTLSCRSGEETANTPYAQRIKNMKIAANFDNYTIWTTDKEEEEDSDGSNGGERSSSVANDHSYTEVELNRPPRPDSLLLLVCHK